MAPSSLPRAPKRRKLSGSTASSETESTIRDLETRISTAIANKSSLNTLADLVELLPTLPRAELVHKAVYALYRSFVLVINAGFMDRKEGEGDEEGRVVRVWIAERMGEYEAFLAGLMKDAESTLRTSALKILMSLVKHLSGALSRSSDHGPQFAVPLFKRVVRALLACPSSTRAGAEDGDGKLEADVRELFLGTWLNVYDDVRWFFLRDCEPILAQLVQEKHAHAHENLLAFLEALSTFPSAPSDIKTWWVAELGAKPPKPRGAASADGDDEASEEEDGAEDDWRKFFDDEENGKKDKGKGKDAQKTGRLHRMTVHQSVHALPSHRAVFTRAWLSLLPRLQKDGGTLAMRALEVMHARVMPHLTRAVMIMDWVGSCVDYGGVVGLLALNTLFILMQDYNLDYPVFYTRLYAFLDKDLLHLKHRARFFRLAELFLSSTHLPATLLASFVKRLSRLSLHAPPSSIVIMIPFTYNILKRHPALMVMIHRDSDVEDLSADPFLEDEPNPNATNALDSSLWELHAMKRHYHAGVATLGKVLEEAFTKPAYPLEDFLDHTYGTLLDAEFKRKIKKEPAVADELKGHLFEKSEDGVGGDVVAELWSFDV
ncbi:ribosome biogenesis protein Noc4 [Amylostereum chailletii]|nr:ribosome biogenesis protein Noc4 [Amylostereum chailletii]